jgi:hypothetical protein
MTRKPVQRFITAVVAAALASIGCDNTNPPPPRPTPAPPLTVFPPSPPSPPSPPAAAIDGVYRLTFTAAPSCQLPDDAMRRTYTATIKTTGDRADATLTDAQFWTDGYCGLMNNFDVHVSGTAASSSGYRPTAI